MNDFKKADGLIPPHILEGMRQRREVQIPAPTTAPEGSALCLLTPAQSATSTISEIKVSRATRIAMLTKVSGMRGKQLQQTFDAFDLSRSEDMAEAHQVMLEKAISLSRRRESRGIGLYSATDSCGCGKTHLCCALALAAIQSGRSVYFTTLIDWMEGRHRSVPTI